MVLNVSVCTPLQDDHEEYARANEQATFNFCELRWSVPFKPGVCVFYLASEVQHFQMLHPRHEVPFTNLGMYTPLRFTQNVVRSVERSSHRSVEEEFPGSELPEPRTYCLCDRPWDSSGMSPLSFMQTRYGLGGSSLGVVNSAIVTVDLRWAW